MGAPAAPSQREQWARLGGGLLFSLNFVFIYFNVVIYWRQSKSCRPRGALGTLKFKVPGGRP